MENFEERVRERAYRLWVEEGCPEGRSEVHWDQARELVAIEENQKLTMQPVRNGEPVEPIEALRNAGEFPTLTDQGEQSPPGWPDQDEQVAAKRRIAAAPNTAPKKTASVAPKAAKNSAAKRG